MPVPVKYTCLKCGGECTRSDNDLCTPCIYEKMVKSYDQNKHVSGTIFKNMDRSEN